MNLRPFWRYYGGKFRAAPRYPKPTRSKLIEPFARSAGKVLARLRALGLVERVAPMLHWRRTLAGDREVES